MYMGLKRPERYRAEPASAPGRKLAIFECASFTKNSVAPDVIAPSIAALISAVKRLV